MRRSLIAVVAGVCLVAGGQVEAKPKHHRSHDPIIHRDTPITTAQAIAAASVGSDGSCNNETTCYWRAVDPSLVAIADPAQSLRLAKQADSTTRAVAAQDGVEISEEDTTEVQEASLAPVGWNQKRSGGRGGYATVHTRQGMARVVAWARERFQGFIDEVQRLGYRVGAPGCLSSGHMRHSKHHWGGACDLFGQVARNRTRLRLPPNHMEIAKRHGLIDGCMWRNPDCGHFEVPVGGQSVAQYMASRGYTRRVRRYVSR
jgi:hypothetical protein